METTIAERVKQLRAQYNMSVKDFAVKCNLSHVAIFHLENGKTLKPHKRSIQRMAQVFGTSIDWIMYGGKEMLPHGQKEFSEDGTHDTFWKDEAYLEIKSRNAMLEKEIERLWQMVSHFTSGSKPDFRFLDAG